jgi:hypothetical protein
MLQKKWQEAGKDLDVAIELQAGMPRRFACVPCAAQARQVDDAPGGISAMGLAPKDIGDRTARDVREAMRLAVARDDPVGLDVVEAPTRRIVGN